ncbi:MAG TPA: Hpt domain-containing protein [Bryobacteraceae bacterium]|nr:Hpt domain-containing protein [Bryobacteraceae bacterium]
MDRDAALSRAGGDLGLLREIASLFLDNYKQWLAEIRDAAARGDASALERAAHSIKGSVANFGARAAVEAAFGLELLGRRRDLGEAAHALNSLELALAALRPELEAL